MDFLLSSDVWYTVSFIIFALVIIKFGKPAFLKYVDGRIEKIREEIETAEGLRTEAHELLAQYERKHRDAVKEADEIIQKAEKHAAEIKAQAEAELEETIARREAQLEERIARLETNAVQDIKNHTANLAIEATAEIIAETLDKKANQNLVDQSIKSIATKL